MSYSVVVNKDFCLPLYLVYYVIMNRIGKTGQMSFFRQPEDSCTDSARCYGGSHFAVCLNSLIHNYESTEKQVNYTTGNLDNREICINTHTHTQELARQYTLNSLTHNGLGIILLLRQIPVSPVLCGSRHPPVRMFPGIFLPTRQ